MKNYYEKVICVEPWRSLYIDDKKDVYFCCFQAKKDWSSFSKIKFSCLGNIKNKSIKEIWNNKKAEKIRKKIIKEGHENVCFNNCPFLYYHLHDKKLIAYKKLEHIHITTSLSCNLNCIMCNQNHFSKKELPKTFYAELVNNLQSLKEITQSGGEIFFEKTARDFFLNFNFEINPHMKFNFITNGTLLTKEIIKKIVLYGGYVNISVGAATKKTYESIRKGANWNVLIRNLKLLFEYRKRYYKINPYLDVVLSFVVMKGNFKEMISFVKLCERFNFTPQFDWLTGNKPKGENLLKIKDLSDLNLLYNIILNLENRKNKNPIAHLKVLKNDIKPILKK
ncbi:MAG: radical SAM protein [Nanoarchaeota archaeon]|nr:radical SAM protein [Nanoarchaeota archaeon]MBU1850213.1 radical SAM protein [Nanoarchaeota archaeon]